MFFFALTVFFLFPIHLVFSENIEKKTDKILKAYEEELKEDPNNTRLLYALGSGYYSQQEYVHAEKIFQRALHLDPENLQVQTFLGLTLLFLNQYDQSQKILEKVLEKEPKNFLVLTGLGRIAQMHYQFDQAEDFYSQALIEDPNNRSALSFLASLRMQQKRYQEAEKIYEELLPDGPSWIKIELEKARLGPELDEINQMVKNGEKEKAIQKYQELIVAYPKIIEIYTLLGRLYTDNALYQEAIDVYQKGLVVNPRAAELLTALGMTYLKQGDVQKSQNVLKKAIAINPHEADAYAGLGRIALLDDQTKEAEDYFLEALKNDPYNSAALTWSAEVLLKEKRYQEAEELYKRLMKKTADAEWVRYGLFQASFGDVLGTIQEQIKRKEYRAAEKRYQTLIEEFPQQERLYLAFGNMYMELGLYQEALQVFQVGLDINPKFLSLQIALANAYLKSGELNKSYQNFQKLLDESPHNTEAMAGIGRIYQLEGNIEEAENLYRQILKIDRENIQALSYLGDLKFKQKKYREAERFFSQIIELQPRATWAKQALENAKQGPILERIEEKKAQGNFDGVERLYLQLIAESPKNVDYYLALGNFYKNQGQERLAFELYLDAMQELPDANTLKIALAFSSFQVNQLHEADALFQEVLIVEPENAEVWAGLGQIKERQGYLLEAERLYQKALAYDQENITALSLLGNLYFTQKRYAEAEQIYKQLRRLLPDALWIRLILQDIKYAPELQEIKTLQKVDTLSESEKMIRQKRAAKLLRQLIRKAPSNPGYFHRLGMQYAEMGRFSEAVKIYKKGLEIDPDFLPMYNSLGFAYIYAQDYSEAKKVLDGVIKKSPNNAEAWAGIGRIDQLSGKLHEAEEAYEYALESAPTNITALGFMGDLKVQTGQYEEARQIYKRLFELQPEANWIVKAMKEITIAPLLAKIREFEEEGKVNKAAELYCKALQQIDDTVDLYLAFGKMYVQHQRYPDAIGVFRQGLDENPGEDRLYVALGIAYVLNEEIVNARHYLEKAYKINPNHADILAGLGRIEAIQRNFDVAENYYKAALDISFDNAVTLSFYADLLMKQKKYDQAYEMYVHLQKLEPEAAWIREGLKSAQYGSYVESARLLQDLGEYRGAECRYWNLIGCAADNLMYYQFLAELYMQMEAYEDAEDVLRRGLFIDPEALHLWRSLGDLYLTRGKLVCAKKVFLFLLSRNQNDSYAWAGLGRLQALCGNFCLSEEYYAHALNLFPRNTLAISYFALGRLEQERFFDAREIYSHLTTLLPEANWVRDSYAYARKKTRSLFNLQGNYHEEREWNDNPGEWVARYQVYGGNTSVMIPVNNCLWLTGFGADDYYRLTNTVDDLTVYYFQVARSRLETRWVFSPGYALETSLGISAYAPQTSGTFNQESNINPEPSLLLYSRTPRIETIVGFKSETDLVGRDFNDLRAKMIARYYLYGSYEWEYIQNFYTGLESDYSWYNDYQHNRSQYARFWLRWNPREIWKPLTIRYHFQYERFDKVIPDYYTYAPQLIHHLQMDVSKAWDDLAYVSLGCAYGLQRTKTQFNQIVVGVPVPSPLFYDNCQYYEFYLNARLNQECFSVDLKGDYHRETDKYTIWNVSLTLGWEF